MWFFVSTFYIRPQPSWRQYFAQSSLFLLGTPNISFPRNFLNPSQQICRSSNLSVLIFSSSSISISILCPSSVERVCILTRIALLSVPYIHASSNSIENSYRGILSAKVFSGIISRSGFFDTQVLVWQKMTTFAANGDRLIFVCVEIESDRLCSKAEDCGLLC